MSFVAMSYPGITGTALIPDDTAVRAYWAAKGWTIGVTVTAPDPDMSIVSQDYFSTHALAKGELLLNIEDYGADPTGVADSTTALQAAADAAATAGQTVYAPTGTFKTSSTVTITGDADLHLATFNYTPAAAGGIAVQVGNPASQLFRARVWLPILVNTKKTTTGWAQTGVASSVGVQVSNAYSCSLFFPRVNNFETGVKVSGHPNPAIQGTQQCDFHPLHLDNNKVNFAVSPESNTATTDSGWANQNTVVGGRMTHNSSEGSQVTGTRQVVFSDCFNIVNGWSFYGTSLESPDVVEYHAECYGQYIIFDGCRWENTGGDTHRRVWSRGTAKNNWIIGGFNAGQITQSKESTAYPFRRLDDIQATYAGGGSAIPALLVENQNSSTQPAVTVLEAGSTLAGDAPSTAYAVQVTAQDLRGKRKADTNERLRADFLNGRIYLNDATGAVTGYIGGSPSALFVGGSVPFCPLATNAQDLGTASLKWRYLRLGTAVQVGAFATASRPAAATAGQGAMILDSTLNKPIWSDGTVWRDATGTSV